MVHACVRCLVCCMTKGGSRCCGVFSFIGVTFLVSLGLLLELQPEFIHIKYDDKNMTFSEAAEVAAMNAWIGAIMYSVTLALCYFSYLHHSKNEYRYSLAQRHSLNGVELESFEDINVPLMPDDAPSSTSGHITPRTAIGLQ